MAGAETGLAPEEIYCSACGESIPEDVAFCPRCGAENVVHDAPEDDETEAAAEPDPPTRAADLVEKVGVASTVGVMGGWYLATEIGGVLGGVGAIVAIVSAPVLVGTLGLVFLRFIVRFLRS